MTDTISDLLNVGQQRTSGWMHRCQ